MHITETIIASSIILGILTFVAITNEQEPEVAEVVEAYKLDLKQTKMMAKCENAMVEHDIVFKDGASQISGCGCIISKVAPKFSAPMMSMASGLLPILFEARNQTGAKKDAQLAAGVVRLQNDTQLDDEKTNQVLSHLFDAVDYCGKNASATTNILVK